MPGPGQGPGVPESSSVPRSGSPASPGHSWHEDATPPPAQGLPRSLGRDQPQQHWRGLSWAVPPRLGGHRALSPCGARGSLATSSAALRSLLSPRSRVAPNPAMLGDKGRRKPQPGTPLGSPVAGRAPEPQHPRGSGGALGPLGPDSRSPGALECPWGPSAIAAPPWHSPALPGLCGHQVAALALSAPPVPSGVPVWPPQPVRQPPGQSPPRAQVLLIFKSFCNKSF